MNMLSDLRQLGESGAKILSPDRKAFYAALDCKIQTLEGALSSAELAKAAEINPYFLKKYQVQVRGFSPKQLQALLETCISLEENFKTGKMDEWTSLELMISSALSISQ